MNPVPTKSVVREYLEMLVGAVILALFVRAFIFQAFKIPTGSMEPNLLIGDHLLVDKVIFSPSIGAFEDVLFGKRAIRRGDVLVFKRKGGGHVGLYVGHDASAFHVLGGNQSDRVSITRLSRNRLVAVRRPAYRAQPANVRPIPLAASGSLSVNEA